MGDDMKLYGQELCRTDLECRTGDVAAAGGVREVVLANGSEQGIRALEFRTAAGLAFDVLVDRAMDIGAADHRGRGFGWRSATGFRHPGLHEYSDEAGLAWLRSFSGLLVTAGLDHTLFTAEVDASQYHYPHRKTVWNGLHGRVANIPARLEGYGEKWQGDRCVLWAEGEVRQAAIFGENLILRRRIESEVGGNEIIILDSVTNRGFDRTPHMYLYHINLGWPLVDEGTKFVAPIARTRWQTQSVADQRFSYQRMPKPQPHFVEQVYEHDLVADSSGNYTVAVVNERLDFGVLLEWSSREFPCFFEWLHLREGAYAMGLEPSTHHVEGEPAARKDGSMIWLEHAESRSYQTRLTVLDGKHSIMEALKEIRTVKSQPEADVPVVSPGA
jgi:uncharacterized protein DUF4432